MWTGAPAPAPQAVAAAYACQHPPPTECRRMALLWNCLQQVRNAAPKIHAAPLAASPLAAERGAHAPQARPGAVSSPRAAGAVSNRRKEVAA